MLAVDLLDCAMVLYMVAGHTKFGPDLVARQVAGSFNKSYCLNHGQLVALMRPYTSAGAYDGKILHTWKNGTQLLFSPINRIMSYRNFLLLADDGGINLTAVDKLLDGFEPFDDTGPVYLDEDLQRECKHAAYRGLRRKVLPELRAYMYNGVSQASVPERCGMEKDANLLPARVGSCRKVRLFTRRTTADVAWREQLGWMKRSELEQVNAALAGVTPYGEQPELLNAAYGAKAKSIQEQYAKYVPREFVPDRYRVPGTTYIGSKRVRRQSEITTSGAVDRDGDAAVQSAATTKQSQSARPSAAESTRAITVKKVRWSKGVHARLLTQALLAPPFCGVVPKNRETWEALVAEMPTPSAGEEWDVSTLKRHSKEIAQQHPGITLHG